MLENTVGYNGNYAMFCSVTNITKELTFLCAESAHFNALKTICKREKSNGSLMDSGLFFCITQAFLPFAEKAHRIFSPQGTE
jgi:hypothetical protein